MRIRKYVLVLLGYDYFWCAVNCVELGYWFVVDVAAGSLS